MRSVITGVIVLFCALAFGVVPALAADDGPLESFTIPTAGAQPSAITLGPEGDMWFTESATDKIGKVTSAGKFTEYSIPTPNAEPNGIVAGTEGDLWFTETAADKIGRITPSGSITEFAIPTAASKPMGIALGGDGNIWFTEYASSKIGRITPTSGSVTEDSTLFGSDGPLYLAPGVGSEGQIWYSAGASDHIGYQSENGTAGETTLPVPAGAPSGSTNAVSSGITVGQRDGAIHMIAFGHEGSATGNPLPILSLSSDLFTCCTQHPAPQFTTGSQMVEDPSGGYWYVAYGPALVRVTEEGIATDYVEPTAASHDTCYSATNPRACPLYGVAFGPEQTVWFTDHTHNTINRYHSYFAPNPPLTQGPPGPAGPTGPPGSAGKPGALVVVASSAKVTANKVTVQYALTGTAPVTLSVGKSVSKTVSVAETTGQAGINSIKWNRKFGKKTAKPGTYQLVLSASAEGQSARSSIKVKLSKKPKH